MNNPTLHEAIF